MGGRPATPRSQSVRCDLPPPRLPGNSEKEHVVNQALATDSKVPVVPSQSAAEAKATNGGFLSVLLAACIASLGGILFGYDSGIISGALLQIREIFDLSCVVQQLVVGSLFLSAFISSFFGGVLVDNLGRKRALLLASALFLSGSALQSLSTSLAMFVTGRFITGFAVSLSTTAQCTYIAEISPAVHRGLLMSLNEVGITVGFLLAYTVNYSFISYENGWQLMFAVATCPALLEMLGTLFLPQSPHFLVLKGRYDEARKVLNVIHGETAASQELNRMQKSLLEEQNYRYRDLFTPGLRGRMMVGVGLVILQQCTGQTNVIYYAPTLLKHLGFCTNVAATLASVGLGAVKVGAALFALLVLDRLGRRVCLCTGVLLMAISIFALGMLAKFSYGSSGHSISLRCRDRPSVFNASAIHYSHMTPPGYDTEAMTTHVPAPMVLENSNVPSSPNQRHKRESGAFSSDSTSLDSSPGLSMPPPIPDQMASSGAGLMDVGYTPGRPSGSPREVVAPSPSWGFDHAEHVAKLSPQSDESRENMDPRRDEGTVGENQSLEMQRPDNGDDAGEEPLIELLVNSTGTKTLSTAEPYLVASSYISDDVRGGKLSYMPETAAASSSHLRNVGEMEASAPSHAAAGGENRRAEVTERRVGERDSLVAAAQDSQCSGVPQGSAFQRALTLAALMCYVFAYGVSFGTTTWLILSEIFPAAVRGRAISVATSANWAANMSVSASFLTVLDNLGVGDTLLMYSGVCMLALCFIFLCVPETKHKTLEEITTELDQGLIRWRTIIPTRWGRASDYTLRGPA
ncbi:solute carrier family 2, facilitated glucose transporter member 10-like isoform X2 [Rhipicephalus microplus]|uniref:solute carrier family 2, facilitated glucose transporter member 10-like isoform X2 n=1 Tax=Rhipicephalus microplus TaxID=6941 RepID=UPI003F6AFC0A